MTQKERQQLLIGFGILRPEDRAPSTTLWKLELKSELGRRAKERTTFFGGRARARLLTGILNRLKRAR